MLKIRPIILILCSAALLSIAACSRKEEVKAGASLLDSTLLARIPASTGFFAVWDTESDGYKTFKESPWAKNRPGLYQACEKLPVMESDTLPRLCKSLKTAGFIQGPEVQSATVRETIVFAGLNNTSKAPEGGVYFSAASGVNLRDKLNSLESALKSDGFSVNKQDFQGGSGFSVELPAVSKGQLPITALYAGATSTSFGVATTPALIDQLFVQNPESGLPRIKSSPEFSRLNSIAGNRAGQIFYAYLDLAFTMKSLTQSGLLQADTAPVKPAEFPLDAALAVSYMDENPAGFLLVSATPRNDDQKRWLSAFSTEGDLGALKQLPAEAALALGLDGKTITSLKDAALNEQPSDQKAAISAQLAPLDGIKSLGLALLGAAGASPVPSLVLTFQSADLVKLQTSLKEGLSRAVTQTGLPVSGWQQRKVASLETDIMQSPMMGLGAFLASTDKTLILASSEDALKKSIDAINGKSASTLGKSLTDKSKAMYEQGSPLAAVYTNYGKLADLIESFQGTVAAFTAGQSTMDDEKIASMRAMGVQVGALAFKDGVFRARMTMERPQVP